MPANYLDQLLQLKMYTCPYCKSRQSINLDAQQETALRFQARQMMSASAASSARQQQQAAVMQRQQQQAAVMQRHQQAVAAAAAYQKLGAAAGGGAAPRPGAPQVCVGWAAGAAIFAVGCCISGCRRVPRLPHPTVWAWWQ